MTKSKRMACCDGEWDKPNVFQQFCKKELPEDIQRRVERATEVVEAMEAYVEHATEKTDETKRNFVSELADIVCCCMIVAGYEDIDLEKAINDCVEKNRKRAEGKGDKK